MQTTNFILLHVGVASVAVQRTASELAEISARRAGRARHGTCVAEPITVRSGHAEE
jgi:hypothetical protein